MAEELLFWEKLRVIRCASSVCRSHAEDRRFCSAGSFSNRCYENSNRLCQRLPAAGNFIFVAGRSFRPAVCVCDGEQNVWGPGKNRLLISVKNVSPFSIFRVPVLNLLRGFNAGTRIAYNGRLVPFGLFLKLFDPKRISYPPLLLSNFRTSPRF